MTFKERFESGERERSHIQAEMGKVSETQSGIKREMNLKVRGGGSRK